MTRAIGMHKLFHEFAHRYDLHTPPGHYQHDHAFVIKEALGVSPLNCRLLDVGCGTGVFLEAAISAGIDGHGIDASSEMIEVSRRRLGEARARVQRMQDISDKSDYDVVCALSWTIHYCESEEQLEDILIRCRRALRSGGLILLQIANDGCMTGAVNIDREQGPSGEPDDTYFIHRFLPQNDSNHRVLAEYMYTSVALSELLYEQHELLFASPQIIVAALRRSGFLRVSIVDSQSISPFVIGTAV
jgi:SAM-dependent methyltransferase